MTEHGTRLGGIKQEIQEFKAEFNSLLLKFENEIQTKFGSINKKLNEIESNIKNDITKQNNESIIGIKKSIIDALKKDSKLFR